MPTDQSRFEVQSGGPFVAIQVGAASFVDEGVTAVLDTVVERGGATALFLATPTWTRGTGGRQLPGHPFPDHGLQEYDTEWRGGSFVNLHPEFYRRTVLGACGRASEHGDWDMFEAVLPEARRRGLSSYAWMEESSYAQALRDYPGFPGCLEKDVWNRPAPRPCFNNPDYRNWHLAIVEDYLKNNDLDGLAWCSERPGPLNLALQGHVEAQDLTCFCSYCRGLVAENGVDVAHAIDGYRRLLQWNHRAASMVGTERGDGAFVELWRLLLDYPEILAWQHHWTTSQRQLYRDIYGTAKGVRAEVKVGWHIYHNLSFSPFYRADQDYTELGECSDFLKVVAYDNCAGPRFYTWVRGICRTLFSGVNESLVYEFLSGVLNLAEARFDDLPSAGFSAEYVRRETERARRASPRSCSIYTGIDIDIPVSDPRPPGRQEPPIAHCTRRGVRDAVLAAFAGGADGVVLSRKYSEMTIDNLSGAGDALRELAGMPVRQKEADGHASGPSPQRPSPSITAPAVRAEQG